MNKTIVIVTGVGFKQGTDTLVSENIFLSRNIKVNIGAATARLLAERGNDLIIISRTPTKLDKVKRDLLSLYPDRNIIAKAFDVLNESQVNDFWQSLDQSRIYSYVHSAGLSTGAYNLKDDNPYLPIEEIPVDLPIMEFTTVVKSLHLMVKGLLSLSSNQGKTKVVVVNSMSGIRAYPLGFSHSGAKGGLHNAVRSLTLELSPKNIYITEVMPGIVDTGLYDSDAVKRAVQRIGSDFGYQYEEVPTASPYSVAESIILALSSTAHILSINLVPEGQFPHQNA